MSNDPAAQRRYRAQRKEAGAPVASGAKHDAQYYRDRRARAKGEPIVRVPRDAAQYFREYRARRKEEGAPVVPGRRASFGGFVAWDGEGITVRDQSGFDPYEWRAMIAARTRQVFDERMERYERLCNIRIVPDMVRVRGRWQRAGEYDDVPAIFLRPNRGIAIDGRKEGNCDQVAATLGLSSDELRDELRSLRRPSRVAIEREVARDHTLDRPRPGKHVYTLFANSRGFAIDNAEGLSTRECFDALLDGGDAYPKCKHVIFGGSYDVNMILRDCSREVLAALAQGKYPTVELGGRAYRLHYRPRKFLFLAQWDTPRWHRQANGKWKPRYVRHVSLWDVFGFFQAAFAKVLRTFSIDAPLQEIETMKAHRATFSADEAERIRAYCFSECAALERLCDTFYAHCQSARITLTRFDGAGAAAAALLRRERVKGWRGDRAEGDVDLAIRTAYAGGRIEMLQIGRGPLFDYDIRSAYPWAASTLPSGHGAWRHNDPFETQWGIERLAFSFPAGLPFYPLFFRLVTKSVQFPREGEGWYYREEAAAARAFANECGGTVRTLETWDYYPDDARAQPFAFIPQLYEQRREWERAGNGAEKVLKLATNAIYGKLCQQLGATADRQPPYLNLFWAGLITSRTRARLVDAALYEPSAVVMFSTDGLFTNEPFDLKLSDALGAWTDAGSSNDAVICQPGVYWIHDKGEWNVKYRGFDRASAPTPQLVLDAWQRRREKVVLPTTRFVTYASALLSEELWPWWRSWRTVQRAMKVTGQSVKRQAFHHTERPQKGWVPLAVAPPIGGGLSTAYDTYWSAHDDADEPDEGELDGLPESVVQREVYDSLL